MNNKYNNLVDCIPVYTCEFDVNRKATGWLLDGCGNRTLNETECPPGSDCIPKPYCELDSNGNRTGYEFDGCGNKTLNEADCGTKTEDNKKLLYAGLGIVGLIVAIKILK